MFVLQLLLAAITVYHDDIFLLQMSRYTYIGVCCRSKKNVVITVLSSLWLIHTTWASGAYNINIIHTLSILIVENMMMMMMMNS